ncbi:MAG: Rid family hydrolase [Oceanicaulis sp.]
MTAPASPFIAAACAALLLGGCGAEDARAPEGEPAPQAPALTLATDELGGHAPARAFAGETIAFSQVLAPAGEDGEISGDVESQTGAALRLLADALEAEGLTLAHVAQLTVHVVAAPDGAMDAEGVARAWRRSFGNRMQPAAPARTIVGVAALPTPGARVSLTALAVRPVPTSSTTDPQ